VPNRERSAPRVRGSFRLLAPEIAGPICAIGPGGDYARAGAGDIRREIRGVTPSSDVNGGATTIPNLGTAAGAGSVSGARNEVIRVLETPQRGSVT
jgi:hypothetical protein